MLGDYTNIVVEIERLPFSDIKFLKKDLEDVFEDFKRSKTTLQCYVLSRAHHGSDIKTLTRRLLFVLNWYQSRIANLNDYMKYIEKKHGIKESFIVNSLVTCTRL